MNISIMDDSVVEMDESFTVTLQSTPDLDSRIRVNPGQAIITITDNDSMSNRQCFKNK